MSDSSTGADPRVGLAKSRTAFANFRTQLALDRTMLAWLRTTLTMATFGFGLIGFFRSIRQSHENEATIALHQQAIRFGEALVVLGLLTTALAGVYHWRALVKLRRNEPPDLSMFPLSLGVAFFVVLLGAAGLWGLLASR